MSTTTILLEAAITLIICQHEARHGNNLAAEVQEEIEKDLQNCIVQVMPQAKDDLRAHMADMVTTAHKLTNNTYLL